MSSYCNLQCENRERKAYKSFRRLALGDNISRKAAEDFDSKFLKSKSSIMDALSCIKSQSSLTAEGNLQSEDKGLDDSPSKNIMISFSDCEGESSEIEGGSCKKGCREQLAFTPTEEAGGKKSDEKTFSSIFSSYCTPNVVEPNLQRVAEENDKDSDDFERASEDHESDSDELERASYSNLLSELSIPGLGNPSKDQRKSLANERAFNEFPSVKCGGDRKFKTDGREYSQVDVLKGSVSSRAEESTKKYDSKKFNRKRARLIKKEEAKKIVIKNSKQVPFERKMIRNAFGSKDYARECAIARLEEGISVDTTLIGITKFLGWEGQDNIYLGQVLEPSSFIPSKYVILKQVKLRLHDKNSRSKLLNLARELDMIKRLNSGNVVRYLALHKSSTNSMDEMLDYSLVMEYMEGGSLLDVAKRRRKRFAKAEIQEILRQVLNGVKYLHSHRIIHRDIKPANILVDKRGTAYKIADFSIATKVDEETPEARRECAGTPWYIAPEVILGYPYSYAADVWSVGCLAFELFTGRRPYDCYDGMDALFQMVDNPSPLSACPAPILSTLNSADNCAFFDLLKKCWTREPARRPSAKVLLGHPFFHKEIAIRRKSTKDKLPVLQKRRPITRQQSKVYKPPLNVAGIKLGVRGSVAKLQVPQTPRYLGARDSANYHYY
eukprot:TRINITY_DN5671_c0_g1_i1.p1 TRINITY_DN5671_c0_g1~~TRINITY_DN5671_c0_g1_i1.p1  ORF type:complete len:666 (-),score=149.06 TRINITY_DN5671_c0_g1_i1:64-2061(-)